MPRGVDREMAVDRTDSRRSTLAIETALDAPIRLGKRQHISANTVSQLVGHVTAVMQILENRGNSCILRAEARGRAFESCRLRHFPMVGACRLFSGRAGLRFEPKGPHYTGPPQKRRLSSI
jgi:hypothetical protein